MAVKELVLHFLVCLLFWPLAFPAMGVILGFLYAFFPATLVSGFIKYGGYLAMPGFTNRSVKIDNIDIHYVDRPSSSNEDDDQPTLVFVHGFTSQKLGWLPLIKFLPSTWRIIAIDLPGHGESGISEDWNCSANGICSLLHKVFTEIGLTHFHIIGESLGSAIAGQFASVYPHMVDSITTLCPPVLHRFKGAPCTPTMAAIDKAEMEDNPLMPKTAQEFRAMLNTVLHNSHDHILHDHMLDAVVGVHSKHYENFKKVLSDVRNGGDTEEDIKLRITRSKHIPSLVLWGEQDQVCDVAGAKLLKKLSPHSKVVILKNCGHCISVERPKKVGQLLEKFIKQKQSLSNPIVTS